MSTDLCWVILTRGDRSEELGNAVASARQPFDDDVDVLVWENGLEDPVPVVGARVEASVTNLGVPGGRDAALHHTSAAIVAFLDDDARIVSPDANALIRAAFDEDPALGAIGFRIVDEAGGTSRRHVPRIGSRSAERAGPVATFLGGACAIRRTAYEAAGGYWSDLFYAHEELDLAWRLQDSGYVVAYDPRIRVVHPRTPISRHREGWRLTGRNRVMIARRDLPWPVAITHAVVWLAIGLVRTPDSTCRSAYLAGWWAGWSAPVGRRPISWRTVGRLARLGRPPVI